MDDQKPIAPLVARDLASTGIGAWNVICNGWVPRDGWPKEVWRRVFEALGSSDGISKVEVTAEAFDQEKSISGEALWSPVRCSMLLDSLRSVDERAARGEERFEGRAVRFAQAYCEGALLVLSEVLSRRQSGLEELRLREFWDAGDDDDDDGSLVAGLSQTLSRNKSLQKLEVASAFTPSSLALLANSIATHPRLCEVEIGARARGGDVVDDDGALATLVSKNRVVEKLTLYDDPLSHAGFAAVCGALETNDTMSSLTLGFAGGDGASPALARLCNALTGNVSRLTTLHIADCGLPSSRLVDFFAQALPELTLLRELKLGFFRIGHTVTRLASALAANTSLRILVMWTVPRDDDDDDDEDDHHNDHLLLHPPHPPHQLQQQQPPQHQAAEGGPQPHQYNAGTAGSVPDLAISDSVVFALADSLARNSTLRELAFENCQVSDEAAAAVVDVLIQRRNTTLRSLSFDSNKIDKSVRKFSQLVRLAGASPLRSLSLRNGPRLGDTGASKLAQALKGKKGITELDLSACGLSDKAALAFAEVLKSRSCPLESLSLTHNKIGDDGARELARALCDAGNTTLARLDLSYNDIDPNVTAFNSAEAFAAHFNHHRKSTTSSPPRFTQTDAAPSNAGMDEHHLLQQRPEDSGLAAGRGHHHPARLADSGDEAGEASSTTSNSRRRRRPNGWWRGGGDESASARRSACILM